MQSDHWTTHRLEADTHGPAMLDREWLLTNGTGAFAAGTAAGCPTRRYHALLVAASDPPVGRRIALNQVWEQLLLHDDDHAAQPLAFNTLMFRGRAGERVFAPQGIELLRAFERGTSVRWHYAWGKIELTRELTLHWHEQAATLRYTIRRLDAATSRATLRLHPMVTLRDFHALSRASDALDHKLDGRTLRVYRDGHCLTLDLASAGPPAERHASQHTASRRTGRAAKRGGDTETNQATNANATASSTAVAERDAFDVGFEANPHWWYGVRYPIEAERGQDDAEDVFVPGAFTVELPEAEESEVVLTASLATDAAAPMQEPASRIAHLDAITQALKAAPGSRAGRGGKTRRARKQDATSEHDVLERVLALAADDFIVTRRLDGEALSTIIAGYPWFADWGRDTFIALPGLLLETGRHDEASRVLRAFASRLRHGLVPNRFDDYDAEAAHYNTVDASLWFVRAALAYADATEDREAWRDWLAPACLAIVDAYREGTDYGIRCDDDGLITAGSQQTQLTWMDAAVDEQIFTPRPGKAVEINALWYNALLGLADALEAHATRSSGKRTRDNARSEQSQQRDSPTTPDALRALAQRTKRSFNDVFWHDELGYLIDHVWIDDHGQTHRDMSCRPNQVFAIALPHSPLAHTRQKRVLAAVRDRLLTPVGLRTLPRDDASYHGRYRGDRFERDAAYHQGTIWPWLIGPYAEAVLRVGRFGDKAKREAGDAIAPLLDALRADAVIAAEAARASGGDGEASARAESGDNQVSLGCIGQLHEIYEAEPDEDGRHRPAGAFAQAWSVAEVLRIWRML